MDGKFDAGYWTPGLLAAELKKQLPEVQYATNIMDAEVTNFEANGKILKQDGIYADSDYFRMFSYPLLQGNAMTALNKLSSIAISNQMALRFFGSPSAAMGRTIRYQDHRDLVVTAVFADPPSNSSQKFDFVINWMAQLEENDWLSNWENNSPGTIIQLTAHADPARVAARLKKFLYNYNHTFSSNFWVELHMQPFGESYLHSNFVRRNISSSPMVSLPSGWD